MADKVLTLRKPEPDPKLVRLVENLLERVKSGEVVDVAYAAATPSGDVGTALYCDDKFRMAGAIEQLKLRMLIEKE